MKQFHQMRHCKGEDWPVHAIVVELGFWDMLGLMFGREIEIQPLGEIVVIRNSPAYDAFASPHVLPLEPSKIPMPPVKSTGGKKP